MDLDLHIDGRDTLIRLVLAVVYGGVIGVEREWRAKPAGMRTHALVGLGAAAFTLITLEMYAGVAASRHEPPMPADPIRVIAAIVGGIGFLGAGSIIRDRKSLDGVTTAASIWVVGSIGVACGGGHHLIAGLTTALVLVVLGALRLADRALRKAHPGQKENGH